MLGLINKIFNMNKPGSYAVPNIKITDEIEEMEIIIPAGSKILCTDCTINDEQTLTDNGILVKTIEGYSINKEANITIRRSAIQKPPITILQGREILYIENVKNENNETIFNLPKGSAVNKELITNTGEVAVTNSEFFLIEY